MKINEHQKELYEESGYWGKETLLDYWSASVANNGEREFVVDDQGDRFTYKEVDDQANAIATYMKKIKIRPSDVVSFQVPVWSEFVLITIACLKVGAVINPIGLCYTGKELEYLLNLSQSKIFFCPTWYHKTNYEEMIQCSRKKIRCLKHLVLLDNQKEKFTKSITLKEILSEKAALKNNSDLVKKAKSNDVAAILYTSGTTGGVKGVMLTHNNIIFSEKYFNKALKLTKDDIIFMPAPLNHATGFHHGIIAPMLIGGKVVLQSKFESQQAIKLINLERCTYSMGSTPFIYDILKDIKNGNEQLNTLKFYLCGGAPIPGDMVECASKYGIKLCEVYGSTESVPHVFVRPEETLELMGTTSGRPMEGIEVRIVDEKRQAVTPGTIGEEASRGPNVFVGYLNDKLATEKDLDDEGWFYSGDLCVADEKENIKVIGRKKDIIVRGGENLNTNYISDYVSKHPDVLDQAVIAMPDERLGERICVYVVLKKGKEFLDLNELLDYMQKKKIPKRYWPERLEIIDKIPRTDSGKVKKNQLRDDLEKRMQVLGELDCKKKNLA
ncbi:medium-chain fatty-acid--CoA ligase [Acetobacterium paludosum]|uniref:Medium-chain fatty-acid--CoA ligase n=1 Tax=Acetobacterium paludosum TaxID=52693 RepID=A0A923KXS8_9FIRM|nr:medium-chain fatty-acid--CoA ligase [Acetobacterium paludosum]MBC3889743.1 medium-chain fatty-acid--CoA ligase [Acetobacterium paludosum]